MATKKLCQLLAVESSEKAQVTKTVTEIYKKFDKPTLFNGRNRSFTPLEDGQTTYPSESEIVQERAEKSLTDAVAAWIGKLDATLSKDTGNTTAKADVVLENGTVIAADVPAPYLVWLEKELTDVHTFISKIPVLDPSVRWTLNAATGLYEADTLETIKTKKMQKALVLYPATEKHPAQTQLITEDVAEGYWKTARLSGGMPEVQRDILLNRARMILKAVKSALHLANASEVEERAIGKSIFDYIIKG